jgi:hypothetical protein
MFVNEEPQYNEISPFSLYLETLDSIVYIDEGLDLLSEGEITDAMWRGFETVKAKVLEFIDKVHEVWVSIQIKIQDALMTNKKINKILYYLNRNNKKGWFYTTGNILKVKEAGRIIKTMNVIPRALTHFTRRDYENHNIEFTQIQDEVSLIQANFSNIDGRFEGRGATIGSEIQVMCNVSDVEYAAEFLPLRKEAIKSLVNLRHVVKAFKGVEYKQDIIDCQRVLTSTIILINHITQEALYILRDAAKIAGGTSAPVKSTQLGYQTSRNKTTSNKVNKQKSGESSLSNYKDELNAYVGNMDIGNQRPYSDAEWNDIVNQATTRPPRTHTTMTIDQIPQSPIEYRQTPNSSNYGDIDTDMMTQVLQAKAKANQQMQAQVVDTTLSFSNKTSSVCKFLSTVNKHFRSLKKQDTDKLLDNIIEINSCLI